MPRRPEVSPTTATLSEAVFAPLAAKAGPGNRPVHPLHVGDTWREPLEAARAEAQRAADHPKLHNYAPVQGEPALRDAIADTLRARTAPAPPAEQIQVVPGATAGLSVVCNALLDPGDEVLLPAPFWPLIRGIVAARGARAVQVPFFDRVDAPGFDPERALERAVTDRTAALYLNSPHNPTGRILPPDVVDAMLRVAHRHDLWVLCDQAYEDLWFGDAAPAPVWSHPGARGRAVACHTLSKSHGLAGARVGWVHGPAPAMDAIRGLQTFQTYCAARPMQLAAVRALREGEGWVREARRLYAEAGRAAAAAVGVPAPEGGTFLFFDASPHLKAGEEDCRPLLERCLAAGVMLTPGASCGKAYRRWARLSFTAVPPEELRQALEQLRHVLG
ncbi:MAG: pyridoxal phosphate-dependent aminotransferase [Myxococcota bacterium]